MANGMTDTVRKVYFYSTSVPDMPGEAFRVLSTLVAAGINLLVCSGSPVAGRAQIDVVPDDTRKFLAAVKKAGLRFTPKKVGFLVQGKDRPGALAENLKLLAEHDINVTAVSGLAAGADRWAAILWVQERDIRRAGRALRARSK